MHAASLVQGVGDPLADRRPGLLQARAHIATWAMPPIQRHQLDVPAHRLVGGHDAAPEGDHARLRGHEEGALCEVRLRAAHQRGVGEDGAGGPSPGRDRGVHGVRHHAEACAAARAVLAGAGALHNAREPWQIAAIRNLRQSCERLQTGQAEHLARTRRVPQGVPLDARVLHGRPVDRLLLGRLRRPGRVRRQGPQDVGDLEAQAAEAHLAPIRELAQVAVRRLRALAMVPWELVRLRDPLDAAALHPGVANRRHLR
mmetsp:Transcript_34782/g.105073  ORF Transcript_34782/g.105073 Transcript_34782/m.105073 type:complete len:257 (+) Transcript_34782:557-1327(+)